MSRILSSAGPASKTNKSESSDSSPWPGGLSPIIPLDEGTIAPVEQFPDNRGPAGEMPKGEPEASSDEVAEPDYADSPLYAPRGPGKYLLRGGDMAIIRRSSEDYTLEGDWTNGDTLFWFADGAFTASREAHGSDIIAPWPGTKHRLLTVKESWIAGDAFYDDDTCEWIDCRTPFKTPSDRRFIRRAINQPVSIASVPSDDEARKLADDIAELERQGLIKIGDDGSVTVIENKAAKIPTEADIHFPQLVVDIYDKETGERVGERKFDDDKRQVYCAFFNDNSETCIAVPRQYGQAVPPLTKELYSQEQQDADESASDDLLGVLIGLTDSSRGTQPVFCHHRMHEITCLLHDAFGETFNAEYHYDSFYGNTDNQGALVMLSVDHDVWDELTDDEYNLDATSPIPLEQQALSILRKWHRKFAEAIESVKELRGKLDPRVAATTRTGDSDKSETNVLRTSPATDLPYTWTIYA